MLPEDEIRAGERACVVEGLTVKQRATSRSNDRVVRLVEILLTAHTLYRSNAVAVHTSG